jgi:hypothetical protein
MKRKFQTNPSAVSLTLGNSKSISALSTSYDPELREKINVLIDETNNSWANWFTNHYMNPYNNDTYDMVLQKTSHTDPKLVSESDASGAIVKDLSDSANQVVRNCVIKTEALFPVHTQSKLTQYIFWTKGYRDETDDQD